MLYTIGHSNQPQEKLIEALLGAGIELLVDVRQFASSRRNPQFNHDLLAAALAEHDIGYLHLRALGGRRQPRPGSENTARRNEGFRGFADYMATPEFEDALEQLLGLAAVKRTAIMALRRFLALPPVAHRRCSPGARRARRAPDRRRFAPA